MKQNPHIHHSHHHFGFSYPVSLVQKLYSILLGPMIIVAIMMIITRLFSHVYPTEEISISTLVLATMATLGRLFVSYVAAVIFGIPLALLATWKPAFETVLLPFFDILESIPILAFFPVIILVFLNLHSLNGAAIFIIFLTMVWNILFTVIGGLKVIPRDIKDAAKVFGITRFNYFRKVLLPSIVPQLVTGSIIAVAQGWNIIIVAEVLHVYIPNSPDLFGIGSIMVEASANGQNNVFIMAIVVMVLTIAFFNYFVWQKLLHYAQRFRFE